MLTVVDRERMTTTSMVSLRDPQKLQFLICCLSRPPRIVIKVNVLLVYDLFIICVLRLRFIVQDVG